MAFLGPGKHGILERVFTETTTKAIFKTNGIRSLVGTGYDSRAPLRSLLLTTVNDDMLDAIAWEHRKGRRLYVATTDMTAGKTVMWDMGAIAASGSPDRRSQYVDILIASIAVPGLIEPV